MPKTRVRSTSGARNSRSGNTHKKRQKLAKIVLCSVQRQTEAVDTQQHEGTSCPAHKTDAAAQSPAPQQAHGVPACDISIDAYFGRRGVDAYLARARLLPVDACLDGAKAGGRRCNVLMVRKPVPVDACMPCSCGADACLDRAEAGADACLNRAEAGAYACLNRAGR